MTTIYWGEDHGKSQPAVVQGAVRDWYHGMSGSWSYLGLPEGEEVRARVNVCNETFHGSHQNIQGGKVYISELGQIAIPYSQVLNRYWELGEVQGVGWPIAHYDDDRDLGEIDAMKERAQSQFGDQDWFWGNGSDWREALESQRALIAVEYDQFGKEVLDATFNSCYEERNENPGKSNVITDPFYVSGGKTDSDLEDLEGVDRNNRKIQFEWYDGAGNAERYNNEDIWIVTHGWNGDTGGDIKRIANAIRTQTAERGETPIILLLNWSEAALDDKEDTIPVTGIPVGAAQGDNRGAATWIGPVAEGAVMKLKAWGVEAEDWSKLNFVGHSLGTFVISEIAVRGNYTVEDHENGVNWWREPSARMSQAKRVIGLDPAADGSGGWFVDYDLDGRWDGNQKNRDYSEAAEYSLAFVGLNSRAGDKDKAKTADQTVVMDYGHQRTDTGQEHMWVMSDFRRIVESSEFQDMFDVTEIDRTYDVRFGDDEEEHTWDYRSHSGSSHVRMKIDEGDDREIHYSTYRESEWSNVLMGTSDNDQVPVDSMVITNGGLTTFGFVYRQGGRRVRATLGDGDDEFRHGSVNLDSLDGEKALEGNDEIYGGSGDDKIGAGTEKQWGVDTYYGGEGQDTFVLLDEEDEPVYLNEAYAEIMDFELGNAQSGDEYDGDRIRIDASLHADGRYSIGSYEGEVGMYLDDDLIAVVRGEESGVLEEELKDALGRNEKSHIFVYE